MRTFPTPKFSDGLLGPDEMVSGLDHLPSSPEVLPKVMDALKDDSASIDSIAALISFDQGVAAAVLQLSNSAYYNNGERSSRIEEAVSRVGLVKVCELVTNAVASELLAWDLPTYSIRRDSLWRQSFTCALASEKIAVLVGLEGRSAYTVGFFHMVGLIAIDAWNTKNAKNLSFRHGSFPRRSIDEEHRVLGFTNAAAAAVLLRRWSFHPAIVQPIRWQFAPKEAGIHVPLACVLHVAMWMKEAAHAAPDAIPPLPEPPILACLGLCANDLEQLRVETKGDYENAVQLLNSLTVS